jgi:predicted glycosyltransferase
MNILFDIGHPAQVHLFKNAILALEANGHQVAITCRDKDVTVALLNQYGFKYWVLGKVGRGFFGLLLEMLKRDFKLWKISRVFKPDILIGGVGNVFVPVIGKIIKKPAIVFDDTEHAKYEHFIVDRLATVILTPSCFTKNLGNKQMKYNGYHELAYLHPNYFKPNPSVLQEIGINSKDTFVVVRFVAWQASHDIGQHGFDLKGKRELVAELKIYGRVFITSESPLPDEFEKYQITLQPRKIHDLLYYATLCISEGATIASECAVLGTPAIYVNALRAGTLDEQEKRYGLVYNFSDPETAQTEALEKALELLQRENLKEEWQAKRERLLSDKIDVTEFMVKFIENYPESFNKYKQGNNNQK